MTMSARAFRSLRIQLFVCLLALVSLGTAHSTRPQRRRVLRGLRNAKTELETKTDPEPKVADAEAAEPKGRKDNSSKEKEKTPDPLEPPVRNGNKNANKNADKNANRNRIYQDYNYFVEACQEELVADVINGGIVQQIQYNDFIYGYCRDSTTRGKECQKQRQEKGFTNLPNDMKLMYVKAFCPEDVEGQVSCLHGINDRGRDYEFSDELEKLCRDLEKLMVKNAFLEDEDNKEADEDINNEDPVLDENVDVLNADARDSQNPFEVYQTAPFDPAKDGYTYIGQTTDFDPTAQPSFWPTPAPTENTDSDANVPWGRPEGPWGEAAVATESITDEATHATTKPPAVEGQPRPYTTVPPTEPNKPTPPPGLVVVDGSGQPVPVGAYSGTTDTTTDSAESESEGMSAGSKVAIVLISLLSLSIATVSVLLVRKHQLRNHRHMNIHRDFFFMCMRRLSFSKPSDHTYDKDDTLVENNGSIGSEEIEFNGPLFDSWPGVCPLGDKMNRYEDSDGDSSDGTFDKGGLDKDEAETQASGHTSSQDEPSTYKSSLLSSFFSKSAAFRKGEDGKLVPAENAIDEIKRAINEAQWQEVYYLASKMASEGNIDNNENLQSALVRTNESGGDYASPAARAHLRPDEATKAAQLDVSLAVGDWITLAARAAVFAALESATNPVPSSISFKPGQEGADECLARARAALEEAQKAAKARQEESRPKSPPMEADDGVDAEETEADTVVFVNADDASEDDDGSRHPREDEEDDEGEEEDDDSVVSNSSTKDHNDEESIDTSQLDPEGPSDETSVSSEASVKGFGDCDNEDASSTQSGIPGPPSIALSNQSTIASEPSTSEEVPFSSFAEGARGPFRRDFASGISQPMEQKDDKEMSPKVTARIVAIQRSDVEDNMSMYS